MTAQERICNAVGKTDDNIIIEAVAGSGKTTALINAMKCVSVKDLTIFVCFNKAVQEELEHLTPYYVNCKTLHSVGRTVLMRHSKKGRLRVEKNKTYKHYSEYCEEKGFSSEYYKETAKYVVSAISVLKNCNMSNEWNEDLYHEKTNFREDLHENIEDMWNLTVKNDTGTVDFDDMIRMPVIQDLEFPQYDNVFVDECQDLNILQHVMLEKMVQEGGRVVAVGDRHQAIYSFRGAVEQGMDMLRDRFLMEPIPLSVSYRCPKVIATIVQGNVGVKTFMSGPDTKRGYVQHIDIEQFHQKKMDLVGESHLLLCKNNAPLIKAANRMVLDGKSVYLQGRDAVYTISSVAKGVVDKYGGLDFDAWRKEFLEHRSSRYIAFMQDMYDILTYCCSNGYSDVKSITKFLYGLYPKTKPPVPHIRVTTIHRAKGLEADNVYFLQPDLLDREIIEDMNVYYVGITRTRNRLFFVDNGH